MTQQATYVDNQSFNTMMSAMMNGQMACYTNTFNNYQLGMTNGSETPKIESTKNLYVKRSEFLKVMGHEDSDRQAVIKVRGIIKEKLKAHGRTMDEEPHYRNAENSSVYSFEISHGLQNLIYRIKVTMPERREFFFIDFERLDHDYNDERDTTELARQCMDEINYLTGTNNMPDAGKACQWAKERKTEAENLYFAPLPEKYRNHDKKSIEDVVRAYMKRYDLDVIIENAKIAEGKKSEKPPIAFCRFKSSEQARQVELKMNGKKWSELGFDYSDMAEDLTMTVKKANKPTKQLDERSFQQACTGLTSPQLFQQVAMPTQVIPASTIPTQNGILLVPAPNGAQLLAPNTQCYAINYVFNQQTDATQNQMAIEGSAAQQQFCSQPVMNQFASQSLLSAEPALQPFPAPSPMSPPAPIDMMSREEQNVYQTISDATAQTANGHYQERVFSKR